ncbi:MAG: uracil-DNA glycosylase [Bdellovibrionales bacterium]|nr:uracil-DNA glycosylase [Bdellovibrionales bacterium]
MDSNRLSFLVGEYLQLWADHGVGCEHLRKLPIGVQAEPQATDPRRGSEQTLSDVRQALGNCMRCQLAQGRNKIVFGSGNEKARLMFVGEGPGANEDAQGLPFVGRAGNLLTKIIEAMGYQREGVYIANVVKCRPPQNRAPLPAEVEACTPFLRAQIEAIRPRVIVALGLPSSTFLTGKVVTMGQLRGRFHPLHWNTGVEVMPTYHPAYLLRNPSAKKYVWEDMKLVRARLETLQ